MIIHSADVHFVLFTREFYSNSLPSVNGLLLTGRSGVQKKNENTEDSDVGWDS